MKLGAIGDIWRAIRKSNKRILRRVQVRWSGISRLTDNEVTIRSPITLICGENGAGKSSLLHTLAHAIVAPDKGLSTAQYCRPRMGTLDLVEVDLADGNGAIVTLNGHEAVAAYFAPEDEDAKFVFLDAGMHVPAVLDVIRRDANFADLLEGVDPLEFTGVPLELARFIIGRNYEEVRVYEIADSPVGDVLPYFEVKAQGVVYATPEMGYGEIAVIYILWALERALRGSLVLIEEPETFLSPRAQTVLMDSIARYVKERSLIVVMTSHSGAIASRLRTNEIIYTTRSAGRVSLHSPARTADLVSRLGLVREKAFVFFVEDNAAEIFARVLVNNYSDSLADAVEFVRCNGEGNVLRALEVLPVGLRQVAHVGVLDGDQRDRYNGGDPRVIFLPGDAPPEVLLIAFARSLDDESLAELLDVQPGDIARACAHSDGDELHNWIHTFAASLSIPHGEVVRRLAAAWARKNVAHVDQFVRDAEQFSSAAA